MRGRSNRTAKTRDAFLEALEKNGGHVTNACKTAKISRRGAYDWRVEDDDFRRAWDEAVDRGTDVLEEEAQRRAVEGTLKPVFQGGVKVGQIREYSDTLLIFTLKARRPEKFRDRVDNRVSGHLSLEQLVGKASGEQK